MLLLTYPVFPTVTPVHLSICTTFSAVVTPLPATQTTVAPSPRYIKIDQLGAVSTGLTPVLPRACPVALPAPWPRLEKTPIQDLTNLPCQPHTPLIQTMTKARLWHVLNYKRTMAQTSADRLRCKLGHLEKRVDWCGGLS